MIKIYGLFLRNSFKTITSDRSAFLPLLSGAQFDLDGSLNPWWTEKSWQNFQERTKCFVDYFNQYQMQGINVRNRNLETVLLLVLSLPLPKCVRHVGSVK